MSKKNNKKHSPVKVFKNLIFMLRFGFKYTPKYIAITLIDMAIRTVNTVIGIIFIKYLFDAIENGEEYLHILLSVIILAVVQAFINLFFLWRFEVYRPQAELAIHEGVQKEFYAKARSLDQSCYDDPEFYNDFIWAIRESDSKVSLLVLNLNVFPIRIISFISIFSLLAYLDAVLALIFIATASLGMFLKLRINRAELEKKTDLNPIERKTSYIDRIFYMPDRAKELRQGEIAKGFRERLYDINDEKTECIRKHSKRLIPLSIFSSIVTDTIPNAGSTAYLVLRYLLDPSLSLGSFSASITASLRLYWIMNEIMTFLTAFGKHSLYIDRVRRFLEYEPKIKGEVKEIPSFESLELRSVSFAYPFSSEGRMVLKNVDLKIVKGEKIALVGYNGAGKSTMIKLLMRLYDVTEGKILYNGKNITEFAPETYREHIGAVFQDYKIFAATLGENVMGGEYSSDDSEKVMFALRAASFEKKFEQLPKGIDTQLTTEFFEDGVGLSGGEAQKVAIARVFARPFELIIMDEPSSALDPISEYELNRSILRYANDKTVIFISHRLSTTRMADRIYMFDGGEVIECGTHDELMALDGKYAEMYRVQAKKYKIK